MDHQLVQALTLHTRIVSTVPVLAMDKACTARPTLDK